MKRFLRIMMVLCMVMPVAGVSVFANEGRLMLLAMMGFATVLLDKKIYVLGGNYADNTQKVQIYDLKTYRWTTGPASPNEHHTATFILQQVEKVAIPWKQVVIRCYHSRYCLQSLTKPSPSS